jgi:desulfoferrodoxin (superoxide reductase-like protein)
MKRTATYAKFIFSVLLLSLTIFCFSPRISYANAPQDVKLEYNASTQNLAVTITHNSSSSGFHYIKYVEIKKNSVILSTEKYDSQSAGTFTYNYKVPAIAGDKLEVTATCNFFGSKTATLTISPAANAGK